MHAYSVIWRHFHVSKGIFTHIQEYSLIFTFIHAYSAIFKYIHLYCNVFTRIHAYSFHAYKASWNLFQLFIASNMNCTMRRPSSRGSQPGSTGLLKGSRLVTLIANCWTVESTENNIGVSRGPRANKWLGKPVLIYRRIRQISVIYMVANPLCWLVIDCWRLSVICMRLPVYCLQVACRLLKRWL